MISFAPRRYTPPDYEAVIIYNHTMQTVPVIAWNWRGVALIADTARGRLRAVTTIPGQVIVRPARP